MNGDFAGGDGSIDNPYLIEDALDLNKVRANLSKSFKLIKDIDLNISPYNTGSGWSPLGQYTANPFTGIFDGNGHIIKNLYINGSSDYVGLFSYVDGGTLENIGLENINIIEKGYIGGFVGCITNRSSMYNCYSTGNINSNSSSAYVGGITGTCSVSLIHNCYSTVNINASSTIRVGGLAGSSDNSSSIYFCYSVGSVIGKSSVGGLIGDVSNSVTSYSYWDEETSNQTVSAGGTGLTTLQMKDPSNFINWNNQMLDDGITPVWKLKEGEYPKLWFEKPSIKCLIKDNNKYKYTQDGNVLNTIANEDTLYNNFNTYGMNDLTNINENIINVLENNKYNINMLR